LSNNSLLFARFGEMGRLRYLSVKAGAGKFDAENLNLETVRLES
jgi:hypothetical protein